MPANKQGKYWKPALHKKESGNYISGSVKEQRGGGNAESPFRQRSGIQLSGFRHTGVVRGRNESAFLPCSLTGTINIFQ